MGVYSIRMNVWHTRITKNITKKSKKKIIQKHLVKPNTTKQIQHIKRTPTELLLILFNLNNHLPSDLKKLSTIKKITDFI